MDLYNLSARVSIRKSIKKSLNVCHFDYTSSVVAGKVDLQLTELTTPVGWKLVLQLTVYY